MKSSISTNKFVKIIAVILNQCASFLDDT